LLLACIATAALKYYVGIQHKLALPAPQHPYRATPLLGYLGWLLFTSYQVQHHLAFLFRALSLPCHRSPHSPELYQLSGSGGSLQGSSFASQELGFKHHQRDVQQLGCL
jgi:hypothetical protein